MAEAECVICHKPITGTAYICTACADQLHHELDRAAELIRELDTTISRQGRAGQRSGRSSGEKSLPFDWDASDAGWAVRNTITTWAKYVVDARGVTMARWLAEQLEWLRHRPEAPEAWDELSYACRLLERTVDRREPQWYAGPCGATDETTGVKCLVDLYARPAASTVRCRGCGTRHDAQDRRNVLLDQAQEELLYAALLARVVSVLGTHVTSAQIRNWAARRRLWARAEDEHGRPLYRVGDVLEILQQARADRAGKTRRAA